MNIRPHNDKGQQHGLWVCYHDCNNDVIQCKGHFINGRSHGLWLWYHPDGEPWYKIYWI
jgi:antitoxin component YwqK of YwqJK toxin-antitoxin module